MRNIFSLARCVRGTTHALARPLAALGLLALAGGLLRPLGAHAQNYNVSTFAGSGASGSANGTGTSASFNSPFGVTLDANGNVYVADTNNNKIRKITPAGVVTDLAGSATNTAGLANGTGTGASFDSPRGLAVDVNGNIYVPDYNNNRIRKITAAGVVTTLAGSGSNGSADGPGASASFLYSTGVAVDASGNVYVADTGNNKIRKITAAGVVTTLAGSATNTAGSVDGTGTGASFNNPFGVAVDASGNVYVADAFNNKIRKITPAGVVTTLAGSGTSGSADGTGTGASFATPRGVAVDASGNVYVADNSNNKIRKITAAGVVTTVAGPATYKSGSADGGGTSATFNSPTTVAVDGAGKVYIADQFNNKIRLASPAAVPVLTSISPATAPVGALLTINGTGLTNASKVTFAESPFAPGTGIATTGITVNAAGTQLTVIIPDGAKNGGVTVTTPGGTSAVDNNFNGPTFFSPIQDLTVTGNQTIPGGTYNSITINAPAVATLGGNVAIRGGYAFTVKDGGTLNDGGYLINGFGSFTLAAGGTLNSSNPAGIAASGTASGTVQTTNARSYSPDANYGYTGTVAQATGTGLPAQVRSLATTNANAVTLTAPVRVAQVLTVGGAGNLVLNGQALTLLSSSTGTALAVNSGPGIVSGGTAAVQRYLDPSINPGTGYRHYSPPVSGSTVADLTTSGFSPEISQASVYNNSATPGTTTPFPTVFGYDQGRLATATNNYAAFDKGFFAPASLSTPLEVGRGYVVQIAPSQLVDFTGQLNTGDFTVSGARNAPGTPNEADAGWQLLGNPYPAPIDFSRVAAADRPGFDASIYVVQSTGAYVGGYRSYINGVGTSALIGSGQSFFMRVSNDQPSASLTFRNTHRLTTFATQAPVYRTAADTRPQVQLALRSASGLADDFYAYAEAGATAGFDRQYDAWKMPNSTGLNLASQASGGASLSIDGRAAFGAGTTIALTVGVPAAGAYTLAAADIANLPAGLTATLRDAQTGQTTKLAAGTAYSFGVTATEATATITGRFTLQFSSATPLATAASLAASEVTVYPNPARERFTVLVPAVALAPAVQVELLNTLGQIVRRQSASLPAAGATLIVETAGLATGVYTLRLTAGASTLAKRVVLH